MQSKKCGKMDTLNENKAYGEGHIASYNGLALKWNPYKKYTKEWKAWKMGWEDDRADDLYWKDVLRAPQSPKPKPFK